MKAYIERLVGGTESYHGVMRRTNQVSFKANIPFKHQRKTVHAWTKKRNKGSSFILLNHEMGTGKSALLMQMYATLSVEKERKIRMIVSVPMATLDQWRQTISTWTTIKNECVLVTNDPKKMTPENLANKSIVVLSHTCLTSIFKQCFKLYPRHHTVRTNKQLRWVSAWDVKQKPEGHNLGSQDVDLLLPFGGGWDVMGVDEAHVNANTKSKICNAHAMLSQSCALRIMMTGTACVNKPSDLAGIAKAGNAVSHMPNIDYQSVKTWVMPRASRDTVNRENVRLFRDEFVDRHKLDVGKMLLPAIVHESVNYRIFLKKQDAEEYMDIIETAGNLSRHMIRRQDGRDIVILMQAITKLSHFLISPLLAKLGAKKFSKCPLNLAKAVKSPSESIVALSLQVKQKMAEGHNTVVIACSSVIEMKIAKYYMQQSHTPDVGDIFMYTGEQPTAQRLLNKQQFLSSKKAVMFLSINAGGSGLHLVPGCACLIFFGMMPYSPAVMQQCMSRVYRYGQDRPVNIVNLIAYGSPEFAISILHKDKMSLIDFIQDNYIPPFQQHNPDQIWKRTIKVVDNCADLRTCEEKDDPPSHFEHAIFTKKMMIAVLMSQHSRLGKLSPMSLIPADLVRQIIGEKSQIRYYTFPDMPEGTRMAHYVS